jgi:rubrerythrin
MAGGLGYDTKIRKRCIFMKGKNMDIFAFAMQMEKDGERFYRELAAKASSEGVRAVLTMLADEEDKHYRTIQAIRSEEGEMEEVDVLDRAKNIFRRMKEFGEKFETDIDQIELYKKAMEIEKKSIDFYLDRADQVEKPRQKQLFQRLAEEEKKHCRLMEGLADFAARPEQWLENAEFFHLEEY